jgi:hypothetical protein
VIPASVLVDARRPAELAHDHHRHVLIQPALAEVGHKGSDARI